MSRRDIGEAFALVLTMALYGFSMWLVIETMALHAVTEPKPAAVKSMFPPVPPCDHLYDIGQSRTWQECMGVGQVPTPRYREDSQRKAAPRLPGR